jgi:glycosyltransferase involved in cell wall biosynthesis
MTTSSRSFAESMSAAAVSRRIDRNCAPEFLRLDVPIIATDFGGIPDIVDLGVGHLVPPEISPRDLTQALLVIA